jgi:hypothetical protein
MLASSSEVQRRTDDSPFSELEKQNITNDKLSQWGRWKNSPNFLWNAQDKIKNRTTL